MTQNNLALLLADSGRQPEAAQLFSDALSTFVAALDAGHPKIQACAENYASLLRDQGRPTAAGTLIERYKVKTAGR
jgi:hypothetical protein